MKNDRMTPWKATARAGAALGLLAATAPAHALFGGIKCPSPEIYLVVCCPKPCPVVDFAKIARNAIKNGVDKMRLSAHGAQVEEANNIEEALGQSGQRAVTPVRCPPVPVQTLGAGAAPFQSREGPEPVHPSRVLSKSTAGVDRESREGTETALERLRQQAVADAWEGERLLSELADMCGESMAKAANAVPRATDVREMVRRTAEMRMAIGRCDTVTALAQAHQRRLRSTRWLHTVGMHE